MDGTPQVVTVTIQGTDDADPHDFNSWHGDSFHFKNEISGHQASGTIDLAEVNFSPAPVSHPDGAARTVAPPAISEPAQPPAQHPAEDFSLVPDHTKDAVVTHAPHDLIV